MDEDEDVDADDGVDDLTPTSPCQYQVLPKGRKLPQFPQVSTLQKGSNYLRNVPKQGHIYRIKQYCQVKRQKISCCYFQEKF